MNVPYGQLRGPHYTSMMSVKKMPIFETFRVNGLQRSGENKLMLIWAGHHFFRIIRCFKLGYRKSFITFNISNNRLEDINILLEIVKFFTGNLYFQAEQYEVLYFRILPLEKNINCIKNFFY